MRAGIDLLLLGLHFSVVAGFVKEFFHSENGIQIKDTCGASTGKNWTLKGSVNLPPGENILYEPNVVFNTVKELCRVDLSQCPPAPLPTSPQACYCKSRTNNKYYIHVASTTGPSQVGMTVQAVLQGRGMFQNIYAASTIGTLPSQNGNSRHVKASYIIDNREAKELLGDQTIGVCLAKGFLVLEVCIHEGHPKAELRLIQDKKTTKVIGGKCVAMTQKFHSDLVEPMTFDYKEPKGCIQRSIFRFIGDTQVCPDWTPTTTPTPAPTPFTIDGVCPDTPRTKTTSPALNGMEVLKDEISLNKSWIIFQRRISGKEDFYRPWSDYVGGFGELTDSFWLGLEKVHQLCHKPHTCEMLIHVQYKGEPGIGNIRRRPDGCYHSHFRDFWLGSAYENYKLHVGGWSGTADFRGKMVYKNPHFSTWDQDHDTSRSGNCASERHGAWWYGSLCSGPNLNGRWGESSKDDYKCISYGILNDYNNPLTFSEIKLMLK